MFSVWAMLTLKVHGFPRVLNGIHEGSGERAVVASDAPLGWRRSRAEGPSGHMRITGFRPRIVSYLVHRTKVIKAQGGDTVRARDPPTQISE